MRAGLMTATMLLLRLPHFLLWFVGQMFQANWQVALDLLTPGSALTPGMVAYRAESRTVWEITALSNLISLTPGTLTVDVTTEEDGRHTMHVLGLYAPAEPDEFRDQLTDLENRMLLVARGARPGAGVPEAGRGMPPDEHAEEGGPDDTR